MYVLQLTFVLCFAAFLSNINGVNCGMYGSCEFPDETRYLDEYYNKMTRCVAELEDTTHDNYSDCDVFNCINTTIHVLDSDGWVNITDIINADFTEDKFAPARSILIKNLVDCRRKGILTRLTHLGEDNCWKIYYMQHCLPKELSQACNVPDPSAESTEEK